MMAAPGKLIPLSRGRFSLSLIAAAIGWTTPARAQDTAAARAASEAAAALPTAPVLLDGVTYFRVRGVNAYPATRRAAEISGAIRALAADRAIPVESLAVRELPLGSAIVAGGRRLFVVFDADAELEGLTRQTMAEVYRMRIAEAVMAYRRDRAPGLVWRRAAYAAAATAVFALLLWLGNRALRRLRTFVDNRYRARVRDVQFHSIEIVRGDQLWQVLHRGLGVAATLLALSAAYIYLNYVLVLFPRTRALGNSLAGILLRPLAILGAGFVGFIPNLIFLVVLVLVARYAIRLSNLFFRRVGNGSITLHGFEPEWALPTERIIRFSLIVFALVIAYPYLPGSGSEAFKGIGLLVGLMFSLGSPSVIGNAIAGLSLAFRRAFRVGDRVRIGEHVGDVAQVRLLTTYLRTPKNEQVVIPNSLILNGEVVNYSTLARDPGVILHTNVGIGYETPWRQVEEMLLEAARRTPGLLSTPEPYVLQKRLGDFAVDYEINVYCDDPRVMLRLYSALHANILDVFNEFGVQIMTPAYEGDPEQPKVVPREKWFASPAGDGGRERVVERPIAAAPADMVERPIPAAPADVAVPVNRAATPPASPSHPYP
jgi:small-conductance mechanosensitive channel